MKRQKPIMVRDWFDEFTRFEKWWNRKMERIRGKRQLEKEIKNGER